MAQEIGKPFTVRRLSLAAAVFGASVALNGCAKGAPHGEDVTDFQCTGDAGKDRAAMVGCWSGKTNSQDFWVNLAANGDEFKATQVNGPKGISGPLGRAHDVVAEYDADTHILMVGGAVFTAESADGKNFTCTSFSDKQTGKSMTKIECPAQCDPKDIVGTWKGKRLGDYGDHSDITVKLDKPDSASCTSEDDDCEAVMTPGGSYKWTYDPSLPNAGITLIGNGAKLHLVTKDTGDASCKEWFGQVSENGGNIDGYRFALDSKED